ncbi:uncharacterized protein EI90DRAFT_3034350 [Cantharellus anzutake]|uniref:uncharacterized protein n=1 Tax=Cantharellus anzutake TaxID=1750568 RepID=UPI001907473C|nr:uncharacterized protein EI90DRAFT_3034350 [Cantharellus anzutake]KAF8341552.1 hypothetical protein EI90DRAFT_3034350 [Cantharellus anzutake]
MWLLRYVVFFVGLVFGPQFLGRRQLHCLRASAVIQVTTSRMSALFLQDWPEWNGKPGVGPNILASAVDNQPQTRCWPHVEHKLISRARQIIQTSPTESNERMVFMTKI